MTAPFTMIDLTNGIFINHLTIPLKVTDKKEVNLTATNIPGRNSPHIQTTGGSVREVSFSLTIYRNNDGPGAELALSQFRLLVNQTQNLFKKERYQNNAYPTVLFGWGVQAVLMEYYLKSLSIESDGNFVNSMGLPRLAVVDVTLWQKDNSILNQVEELARFAAAQAGQAESAILSTVQRFGGSAFSRIGG